MYVTLLLLDLLKAAAKSGPAARIVWVTSLGSQLVNPPVIGKGGALGGDKGVDEINWNDLKCAIHLHDFQWNWSGYDHLFEQSSCGAVQCLPAATVEDI